MADLRSLGKFYQTTLHQLLLGVKKYHPRIKDKCFGKVESTLYEKGFDGNPYAKALKEVLSLTGPTYLVVEGCPHWELVDWELVDWALGMLQEPLYDMDSQIILEAREDGHDALLRSMFEHVYPYPSSVDGPRCSMSPRAEASRRPAGTSLGTRMRVLSSMGLTSLAGRRSTEPAFKVTTMGSR